jgi:hypothetical protein
MDKKFLAERMKVISEYRKKRIARPKEKEHYSKCIELIVSNVFIQSGDYASSVETEVNFFEQAANNTGKKNGLLNKYADMRRLACQDARDVVRSMERWEGVQDIWYYEP